MKHCYHCGERVEDNESICPACGAPCIGTRQMKTINGLEMPRNLEVPKPGTPSKDGKSSAGAGFAVAAALLAGMIFLLVFFGPLLNYDDWFEYNHTVSTYEILKSYADFGDDVNIASIIFLVLVIPPTLMFFGGIGSNAKFCQAVSGFGIAEMILLGVFLQMSYERENVLWGDIHLSLGFWLPLAGYICCGIMSGKRQSAK